MVILKKLTNLKANLKITFKKPYKVSKQTLDWLNLNYRVKGSTLMETLIATVLIIIVFMLASMILNNLFSNTINNNTQAIKTHLNELQYLQQHKQLEIPYIDTFQFWKVSIDNYQENNQSIIKFKAINIKTNTTINFTQNAGY